MNNWNRRDFLKCAGAIGSALAVLDSNEILATAEKTSVTLVKAD